MVGILGKTVLAVSIIGTGALGYYTWYKSRLKIVNNAKKNFPDLSKHNNYLSDWLTESLYEEYFYVTTPNGVTLDQCIQTGVDNKGHPFCPTLGILAGDEESYEVFRDLFYPIIRDALDGFDPYTQTHDTDMDFTKLDGSVLDSNYVTSASITTHRNIRGFRLPPACNRAERREVERIVSSALEKLKGSLTGEYNSYKTLKSDEEDWEWNNILQRRPDFEMDHSAGILRDWPDARGMYQIADKSLVVWVNEKDHLRITSSQNDGNLTGAFIRLCTALKQMQTEMRLHEFMHSRNLGFITTDPINLGTGLEVEVQVKLPLLSDDLRFRKILKVLRLQQHSFDDSQQKGIITLSNIERIGNSEVTILQKLIDGVRRLVLLEKLVGAKEPIARFLPSGADG